ncbi:MAG: response regulator [Desulfobacterales bacterium]|nr:response regulator [Desulfobacterales bacterium]
MKKTKLFLILDDEKSIRQSIAAYMEDIGYTVFQAASGEDALEIVKTHPIDDAVVDIRLPGIDGNIFMIEAKKIAPDINFVIHTGSADYVISDSIAALGVTPEKVIIKPARDLEQIRQSLENEEDV